MAGLLPGLVPATITDTTILDLALRTMMVAAKLSAPFLVTSLVIGFTISLFQSMTQIQEATLSFVPKVIGVAMALLFCGNWMLHTMITFTTQLFERIPSLLN
ncbi:flagellar biosynthesis protein FliQ [Nocardioides sp.]|uniref:flagellar biosynthesis protein FliQ n=1 Tax=Nocardioides sp. TaxID=35761 RepID=UPI0026061FFF|nr:flagellar biosynthesis protein FliQ [Nocardioides sp.]